MKKEKTFEERYQELKALVPEHLRKEFELIESGERLPDLTGDIPFKNIFDVDVHPERISQLLRLVYHENLVVTGSAREEAAKASIYSKKTIMDILARLSNNGLANAEMQVAAQEFIAQRTAIYASELIIMQYSVKKNQLKSEVTYNDIPTNYLVVLMKESPKLFKDNPSFIHHKMEVTDTGVELTSLAKIVYIELDKCLQQVRENTYPKDKEELCFLLAFMADVNGETAKDLAKTNPSYSAIQAELANMNKDKEAMLAMLADKYEEIIHNSEIKQARDEGMDIGEKKGIAIGEKKGIAIGEKKGMKTMIQNAYANLRDTAKVAALLDLPEADVIGIVSKTESDSPPTL
ncbi:MAG: PD-(D/E)XK nuclease family transposase [Lachnospiraceae bacterium]|nr:PD-(D/E)XK nuclease family transposase [Lachnospiraceae bacterium]